MNISSLEKELILTHILQKSREYVLMYPEINLNRAQKAKFGKLVKRRMNNEPLAYILGHKEFYGLDFKVNKNILIPRPETEQLVDEVLKLNPKNTNIIDIGTGSGNIIITLAKYIKSKNNYFAIDISGKALYIAKQNAKKYNLDKKIKFIHGNLLNPFIQNYKFLPAGRQGKIKNSIIVANLPYLSRKIYNSISSDIKNFEPKSALLSGTDGLYHYRKLFSQIKSFRAMCNTLQIYLEFSPEQKIKITRLIKKYFPKAFITFKKDLSGRWRIVAVSL